MYIHSSFLHTTFNNRTNTINEWCVFGVHASNTFFKFTLLVFFSTTCRCDALTLVCCRRVVAFCVEILLHYQSNDRRSIAWSLVKGFETKGHKQTMSDILMLQSRLFPRLVRITPFGILQMIIGLCGDVFERIFIRAQLHKWRVHQSTGLRKEVSR